MPERSDPRVEHSMTGAPRAEKGTTPMVPEDVVLRDYVMLDFVDDFFEPGEQPASAAEPA